MASTTKRTTAELTGKPPPPAHIAKPMEPYAMTVLSHEITRNGITFQGAIAWNENEASYRQHVAEDVVIVETLEDGTLKFTPIHGARFEARLLGSADRDEYLRVMTASVIDRHFNPAIKSQ